MQQAFATAACYDRCAGRLMVKLGSLVPHLITPLAAGELRIVSVRCFRNISDLATLEPFQIDKRHTGCVRNVLDGPVVGLTEQGMVSLLTIWQKLTAHKASKEKMSIGSSHIAAIGQRKPS